MHHPPLILIVDDMPENADILKTRLESQGYEVGTADNIVREMADETRLILRRLAQ